MSAWGSHMDELRARAEAGDSAGQIAAALAARGLVVSRSAVIGKLRRAGIPLKGASTRSQARCVEERRAAGRPVLAPSAAPAASKGTAPVSSLAAASPPRRAEGRPAISPCPVGMIAAATSSPTPEAPAPAGPVEGVPLIGLPFDRCRWPVAGEGAGLLVCGGSATRGAYCAARGQLAYQPLGTPLRLPADPTVRPVRSRERERSFMDAYGEAV